MSEIIWKKSTRCESSMCVEVAATGDGAAIRNNTRPDEHLTFAVADWRAFIDGVRGGDFDAR